MQLKLKNFQLVEAMLNNTLLSNSLCQLASYNQSYYFNMQILDGPPERVLESGNGLNFLLAKALPVH
jgi:hypothetical protein